MANYRSTPSSSLSKINSPAGENTFKRSQERKRDRRTNENLLRDTSAVSEPENKQPAVKEGPATSGEQTSRNNDEDKLIKLFKSYEEPPELFWSEDVFQKWLKTEEADVYIDNILDRGFFSPPGSIGMTEDDQFNSTKGRKMLYMRNKPKVDNVLRRLYWHSSRMRSEI